MKQGVQIDAEFARAIAVMVDLAVGGIRRGNRDDFI
jgi:hypothetical protein